MLLLLGTLVSCLDEDSNEAKSTQNYYGIVDSITYSNEGDTIYEQYIIKSLTYDSVVYTVFSKSATVNISNIDYATALCDYEATSEISTRAKKITLNGLLKTMYKLYASTSLSQYKSYSEIPLKAINVHYSLKSTSITTNGQMTSIYSDTIYVK